MAKVWISKKNDKWVVGWYNEFGKRKSKVQYSRPQAEGFAADITVKLNAGNTTSLCRVPWDYLLIQYFNSKEAQKLKPASIVEIKHTLKEFARLVGKLKSTQITQEAIDEFKLKRGRMGISNSTLNKDLANLKAFVRFFSIDRAYIKPDLKFQKVKAVLKPVQALTEEQVQTLLRSLKCNSPDYYIRALLALSAALRISTIDRIEISEIHFDKNTIDTFSPKTGKWWMDRPIQPAVMSELSNYLSIHTPEGSTRLLAGSYRRPKWLRLTLQAGIKTTFHNLRKTCCSLMQQRGVSTAVAAKILEHSSPATTRKWYTDVSPAVKRATEALPVQDWIE
jgi:integrase